MNLGIIQASDVMSPNLIELISEHDKYQINMPVYKRYIIWTYTLYSTPLNYYLFQKKVDEQVEEWISDFFRRWIYSNSLPEIFLPWKQYFGNTRYKLVKGDLRNKIATKMIKIVTKELIEIILKAPRSVGSFKIYKGGRYYSSFDNLHENSEVKQAVINSSTYDPHLNISIFTSFEQNGCCAYQLTVNENIPMLVINKNIHAYPHEREILLPPGVSFRFKGKDKRKMGYSKSEEKHYFTVQREPYLIGEVYRQNPHVYCESGTSEISVYDVEVIGE